MFKLFVSADEVFPVYSAVPDGYADPKAPTINLTQQEYEDYLRVQNEWRKWQNKLRDMAGL